ncbi:MAG: NADH:ubiquinone reductase (Na(+)-transporting) subunit F [Bacteroidales bacterium]|jgi:Na+-transporting NADH:ubiquinone oxidoreductase subunit F|nr:NADH:ubiquinone reductase (Na(+)-transporting) subunit F [Bacteroidales bacterium]
MNGLIIIISIIIFLIVIWLLVIVLLFARKKLIPGGKATIHINNDEKSVESDKGITLLNALSGNQIFMSSACGGGGTCGACKGIVLSGGGTILPTETSHITRKMQEEQYRLFCQVKVKEDLDIEIPPEIFGVKKWQCEVISNKNVATYIKEFIVKLPDNETLDFRSGGYIQVDVPKCNIPFSSFDIADEYRQEWDKLNLFDLKMKNNESEVVRAYSMANCPAENNIITLNVRIATPPFDSKKKALKKVNPGICSSYIFSLKSGDKITISGPYGEFFIKDTDNEIMFIGGGAGMAPMRSHIFDLFKTKQSKRKTTFWYGGRSLKELFYIDEFQQIEKDNDNFSFHVALSAPSPEDNWTGDTGFIHEVILEKYLSKHPFPEDIEYYICGPGLMLDAVLKMLDNLGVPKSMIFYDDFGN